MIGLKEALDPAQFGEAMKRVPPFGAMLDTLAISAIIAGIHATIESPWEIVFASGLFAVAGYWFAVLRDRWSR